MRKRVPVTVDNIEAELLRTPFSPFRLHLKDGRKFDVAHREVARLLPYGVLVFLGLKEGTRHATGYDRFPYDAIARIERLSNGRAAPPRRKAS